MILAVAVTRDGTKAFTFENRDALKQWMSKTPLAGIMKLEIFFDVV
jgi:hypothetical protein